MRPMTGEGIGKVVRPSTHEQCWVARSGGKDPLQQLSLPRKLVVNGRLRRLVLVLPTRHEGVIRQDGLLQGGATFCVYIRI